MLHRFKTWGFLLILATLVITSLLYCLAKPEGFDWTIQRLRLLSQFLALIGTTLLAWSFFLSSRLKQVERWFGGIDIVYKLHHIMGALSFVFLLHHPLLLIVQVLPNTSAALTYIIPGQSLAYTSGIAALTTMILLILLTLFIRMPYQVWKRTHSWMGLVLLLAMIHVYLIPSDTSRYLPLQIWMLSLLCSGLISYVIKQFLYHYYTDAYLYEVSQVHDFDEVVELRLKVREGKKLPFAPGQFIFVTIDDEAIGKESHPFSIASSPNDPELIIFCKKSGDYTKRLGLVTKGTNVQVYGPYGTFFERLPATSLAIGIAGGIGITPFLSFPADGEALDVAPSKPTLHLFHVVRHAADSLPYHQRLEEQHRHESFRAYLHESATQGRFSIEAIVEAIPQWQKAVYFLCGPMPMMQSMRLALLKAGVRPSKIIFEDFSFK